MLAVTPYRMTEEVAISVCHFSAALQLRFGGTPCTYSRATRRLCIKEDGGQKYNSAHERLDFYLVCISQVVPARRSAFR